MTRRAYAFTDPLGASDAGGTRQRIRFAHALIHGAGAVSLLLALLEVDGTAAQHVAVVTAAVITGAIAVLALSGARCRTACSSLPSRSPRSW